MTRRAGQFPTSVDVMGVPFRVEWDYIFDDPNDRGECLGIDRLIRIGPHIGCRDQLASTFLHELLHAVLYVSGLEDVLERHQDGMDETVVKVIEHGLFPLIASVNQVNRQVRREALNDG